MIRKVPQIRIIPLTETLQINMMYFIRYITNFRQRQMLTMLKCFNRRPHGSIFSLFYNAFQFYPLVIFITNSSFGLMKC